MSNIYSNRSRKRWLVKKIKTFFISNSLKRLSAKNEIKDYGLMLKDSTQALWDLHSELEKIRLDSAKNYKSYDYGNGYYYQSFKKLNISGYRNTEERIQQLDLRKLVTDKNILDIGSNSGFVLLSLAKEMEKAVGVEFNPYLVETSNQVKKYLGVDNVDFITDSFENYNPPKQTFDIVLSLANHSTYDKNTKQSVDDYFEKTSSLLKSNGQLLFESHPPQIEPKEKLEHTINAIKKYYTIEFLPHVKMNGFLDKNRTYLIGTKKE